MANRRFIDFPIASTVGDNDIVLIWQDGLNKQTTKGTLIQGAPTTLEGLTDVDIAGLINGQILQYNSVTGKWENVDRAGLNLSELGDVSIVSPSNGQVLVYNSTTSKWENSSGGYVPYTGAVTTVDLGAQGLRAGYIRFDTSVVSVPDEQGLMYWDDSRSTVALIMNGTLQHIGQDTFFYSKNATGSSIAKGTAVRFDGTDGASGHIKIAPFLANGTYPSNYFMGVTAETIANGGFGQVMHFGELDGINTSGYTAGALLYASTTVAGGFQTTAPVAPNNIVLIAAAINSKNNGSIIVRPTYGSNINQDEGVKIVSPTTGDLLQLQAGGLWENKSVATVMSGYVPNSRTITINGTTQDLSANRTYNVGTVTSVAALTLGTSGTDLSSTVANGTTTPVITLNVPTASATNRGALSSADWTTFNNKENAITAGTTAQYFRGDKTFQTLNTSVVPEGTNLYYTEARVNANTNVAANTAARHNAVTLGTSNGLSLSTQVLSLGLASAGVTGALSGTDWSTFNSKQNALTNPVTGTGTTNYLPKFTGSTTIGNSTLQEVSGNLGLGVNTSSWGLFKSIEVGTTGNGIAGFVGGPSVVMQTNAYYNGTNWIYANTGNSAQIEIQGSNIIAFKQASSGTAGTVITYTQQVTLFSDGNLLLTSGTVSNAGFKLDVNGTGRFSGALTLTAAANRINSGNELRFYRTDNAIYTQLYDGGNANGFVLDNRNGEGFSFQSAGTNQLRITSAGDLIFKGRSTTTNYDVVFYNDNSQLAINANNTNVGKTINFNVRNDQNAMTITSGGNVGIATPSPGAILHTLKSGTAIAGIGDEVFIGQRSASTNNAAITVVSNNEVILRMTNTTSVELGKILYNTVSNFMRFDTNSGERMSIDSSGNVLIGTGTVNSKLQVAGSFALPHVTKSANYTLNGTDYTVGFDCASNRTATLPDATTCAGRIYVIYQYNTGAGARSVTLDGNGSQTINGMTTYSLSPFCDLTSVMIQSNGSNWIIIASNFTVDCM
jgi:hypothetical protein